jgi:ribonuclease VapC
VTARYVTDASALLALLQQEPGAEAVEAVAEEAAISAVNWSEVCQRALARGVAIDGLRADVEALGVQVESFDAADAEAAARLWERGQPHGLSLGDRACLALAKRLAAPALTSDRAWAQLDLDVEVRTIR